MRKKIVASLVLVMGLMTFAQPVLADEFSNGSNYDSYQGGYITSSEKHWTSYKIRSSNITVGAGIRIQSEPTKVSNGIGSARVESQGGLSPYVAHTHYKYVY